MNLEQIAKELTEKFGVENAERTIGYRMILNALRKAYQQGRTDGQVEERLAIEEGWLIDDDDDDDDYWLPGDKLDTIA